VDDREILLGVPRDDSPREAPAIGESNDHLSFAPDNVAIRDNLPIAAPDDPRAIPVRPVNEYHRWADPVSNSPNLL